MAERVESTVFVSLDETNVGDYAPKLPLHITVVPPFAHDRGQTVDLENAIDIALKDVGPFQIEGKSAEQWASGSVRLIGSEALHRIHEQLIATVQGVGSVEIDTTWTGENYNPHSSSTTDSEFGEGEVRTISSLYFGQKQYLQSGKLWHVADKFRLGR